ncbi:MAG TPA: hypothetical protein VFQ80_19680 [Thermomicrobiales bacterium]|nr:hypothetical protein [Thermomicrobiales bacterium]
MAALDVREVVHQANEGRPVLVGLALVVLALHLGIAIAAAGALSARSQAVRWTTPSRGV